MKILDLIKQKFADTFYPKHIKCICCKSELNKQNVYDICEKCYSNLPFLRHNLCIRCGLKFDKQGSGTCLNCKANNFYFELARSALNFEQGVVKIIHKFKYAKYKFLAQPLSYLLYDTLLIQDWKLDAICYVPLHNNREKQRGYNQSRELANCLSSLTNLPILHNISRIKDTPTQTKLSRKQRQENVKDCFKISDKNSVKNLNILLIDDVFTTGSTTNEISKILKQADANKVYVLTIAHAGFKQKI